MMRLGVATIAGLVVSAAGAASADNRALPPHRDAFTAAWGAAHACLVGAPPWSDDLEVARNVQVALGAGDCSAALMQARRVARDADVDSGYHLVWFRVERAVATFHADEIETLPELEATLDKLIDLPPPAAASATLPRLANAAPMADTAGATDVSVDPPTDHKLTLVYERDGASLTLETDGPDPTTTIDDGAPRTWDAWLTKKGIFISKPEHHLGVDGEVLSTFGDGGERALVYRDFGMGVWIVRSHDAGAHWGAPVKVDPGPYQAHSAKRAFAPEVDVIWSIPGKPGTSPATSWLTITGTGPVGKPRTIPGATIYDGFCGTARGLWWIDTSAEKRVGFTDASGSRTIATLTDIQSLGACAADFILVHTSTSVTRCDRTRCDAAMKLGARAFADVTAKGELQYIIPIGDLLVIGPANGGAIKPRVVRVDGNVLGAAAFYGGPLHAVVLHAGGISLDPVYP